MKVALLQLLPGCSLEENLIIGTDACRKAQKMGADIALFPEMWSNGYHISDDTAELCAEGIDKRDAFIQTFAELACKLNIAIGITYLEQYDPAPRNSITLFDRHGNEVLTYAKVHTCDFDLERNLTPGDDFYVENLDTAEGNVRIGSMICYDREFPESARILMLKGAEIILVPNACPMEINRLDQLRTRAFENMLGIATCNYPAGQPDCNGRSSAFDGIPWLTDCPSSRDMCILKAGWEAGIFVAEFDMSKLRAYREREVFGNAYRHPNKYRVLTEKIIQEPFIRQNYRP